LEVADAIYDAAKPKIVQCDTLNGFVLFADHQRRPGATKPLAREIGIRAETFFYQFLQ
jgi:hypothetical protein